MFDHRAHDVTRVVHGEGWTADLTRASPEMRLAVEAAPQGVPASATPSEPLRRAHKTAQGDEEEPPLVVPSTEPERIARLLGVARDGHGADTEKETQ